MANEYLQERLRTALNKELIKRLMIRYFVGKGFTEDGSFDKKIYPLLLQDLAMQIPQMMAKLEVEAAVEDIDPRTGITKLCWNLFVNGNQRMFLGFSTHTSLSEVRTAIQGPLSAIHRGSFATPKRVINFVTSVLGNSENGDIASMPKNITIRAGMTPLGTGEMSGYFRTSHRPVF